MPGYILHQGSTILCAHGGQAQPTVVSTRVTVSGQAVCLQPNPHSISGCPFATGAGPQPCLTASWTTATTRVTSMGMPILIQTSQATCAPNGTPVNIVMTQTRVTAT
jgi:hypothetical protein